MQIGSQIGGREYDDFPIAVIWRHMKTHHWQHSTLASVLPIIKYAVTFNRPFSNWDKQSLVAEVTESSLITFSKYVIHEIKTDAQINKRSVIII